MFWYLGLQFTSHAVFTIYVVEILYTRWRLANSNSNEASSPNSPIIHSDEKSIPTKNRPKLVKLTKDLMFIIIPSVY